MPMKRRAILFFLLFLLQMGSVPTLAAEPTVAAQGAALIDGKTGRLLWGKNADAPLAMASTTKIMTAILVLERARLTEVVTVSKNAAQQPKVHMSLQEGEQWQVGDLLSAMLLRSYNDAAVALAAGFGERGEVLRGNDEEGKGNRRKGYGFWLAQRTGQPPDS